MVIILFFISINMYIYGVCIYRIHGMMMMISMIVPRDTGVAVAAAYSYDEKRGKLVYLNLFSNIQR